MPIMEEVGNSDQNINPDVSEKGVPEIGTSESFENPEVSGQEELDQLTENLSGKLHNQGREATEMGNKILEDEIKVMGGTEDDLAEGKVLIAPFKEQIGKDIRQGEYEMQNVQEEGNQLGQEGSYDEQVRKLQVESLEDIREANKLQGIEQIKALQKIQADRVKRLKELKKMKNSEEAIETETENLESENIVPKKESIEDNEDGKLKGLGQEEKKEKLYPLAKRSEGQIEEPDGANNQTQDNKDNVIDAEFTIVKENPDTQNKEIRISSHDQTNFDAKIQEARDRVSEDDKLFEKLKDEVKNIQSRVDEMLRSGDLENAKELMKKQRELLDKMKNLVEEGLEEEAEEEEEEEETGENDEEDEDEEQGAADASESKTYKEPEEPRVKKVKEIEVQKKTNKWGQWGRTYIKNLNAMDKEISKIPGAVIGAIAGATPPLLRTVKLMVKEIFSQIGKVTGGGEFFAKMKNTWHEVRGPKKTKE